ncbi:CubicO group peptidase, beta-lactamase class C family [Dyella jiangningensis]|nr:CubicO group peptidase (beta-lactamase class C family) [Dyella sp. AtDHG13]SDL43071.1 CubicO group peptidase, beta-lactamase class C family [Dyella jiangningensis]
MAATTRSPARRMARWALAAAVAFSTLAAAAGGSPSDAAVATQAQALLDQTARPDAPGMELLIARGDRVLFHAARGSAEIELGVPLRTGQVYRIASITKMFTAAEVLKLAEQGRVSLDDTLDKYLPDFPNASHIRLRQLLNHTAGISDVAKNPQPGFFARKLDTATLLAQVASRDPAFAPGTQQSYSNGGYAVLGAVIEKVTGKPWHEAIREQLLEPLGLRQTGYGDNAAIIPGRVAGYTTDTPDHGVRNASYINASVPAAAGAFVSTAEDLFHWMRALTGGKVIGNAWFAQMTTPASLPAGVTSAHPYGLGVYLWQVRGKPMIGHTGQIDGFASAVAYVPSAQVTVVVLANDDHTDARTLARRLAALAMGEPYDTPVAVSLSKAELDALQGSYRIDGATLETLSVKDGQLFAQRTGRHAVPLQATAQGRLYFVPDELSYFQPVHDAQGKVIRLDYVEGGDAPAQSWPRVDATP